MGAFSYRLQADTRPATNQPRRNIRSLVTFGDQVCRRLRRPCDRHLLLRGGERLVGVEALEEAYP